MSSVKLTDQLIQQFQEDGAVLLKGVFNEDWVKVVRTAIQKSMDNPSSFSEMLRPNPNEGGYFNDYCNWQKIPEIRDYVYNSPAASIVGQLMKCKFRWVHIFLVD